MKILFIDDKEQNLESAKSLVDSLNSGDTVSYNHYGGNERELILPDDEPRIKALYVSDGKSALEKVSNQNFDAILSDIFFHFDGSKTPDNIRKEVADILGLNELNLSKIKEKEDPNFSHYWTQDMVEASKPWTEGSDTPPLGVFIASKILQENPEIPIFFCSMIWHHDNISNSICLWTRKMRSKKGHLTFYDDHNNSIGSETKQWECSFSYLSRFSKVSKIEVKK